MHEAPFNDTRKMEQSMRDLIPFYLLGLTIGLMVGLWMIM